MPVTFAQVLQDEMKRLGGNEPITYRKMAKLLKTSASTVSRMVNDGLAPTPEVIAELSAGSFRNQKRARVVNGRVSSSFTSPNSTCPPILGTSHLRRNVDGYS